MFSTENPLERIAGCPVRSIATKKAVQQLSPIALFNIFLLAIQRWKADPKDYFTSLQPTGINVEVSNGNRIVDTWLISEFCGLREKLYVMVEQGEEIVIMIFLPKEF